MTEKSFYERKRFYPVTAFFLLLNIAGIIACVFYNASCLCDELEHLRAAWFVSQGEMPYRDFFEHHHPLVWFLLAPLVSVVPHTNIAALYAGKSLAALFSAGTTVIFYALLKRFFGGAKVAFLGTALSLMFFVSWYGFSVVKPDTFMRFFYFLGLYEFFVFCAERKTKSLLLCGIFFTIAFLFLQTILINIFPLFFPLVWLFCKKKITFKQIAVSAVIPLCMLTAALLWLIEENALQRYFELNWVLNAELAKHVLPQHADAFEHLSPYVYCALALWLWLFFHRKSGFYLNTIALLLVCDFVRLAATPLFLPHYLQLCFFFCSIIYATAAKEKISAGVSFLVGICLLLQLLIHTGILLLLNTDTLFPNNNVVLLSALEYLDKSPEEAVMFNNGQIFDVYAPRYHEYYWHFPQIEVFDSALFNRYPEYDINRIAAAGKINYIFPDDDYIMKNKVRLKGNKHVYRFFLSEKTMRMYDEVIPYLWRLKPEYRAGAAEISAEQ